MVPLAPARLKAASWRRLAEIARAADKDPWRNAIRDQFDRPAPDALPALKAQAASKDALEKQPVDSLLLLSEMLAEAGDQPTAAAVLKVAGRRFPKRFLGVLPARGTGLWGEQRSLILAEASRFFAAAVALRRKARSLT